MRLPLGLVLGLNLPSNPDHRLLACQTGVVAVSDVVRWRWSPASSVGDSPPLSERGRALVGFRGSLPLPALLAFEDVVSRNRTGLAFRPWRVRST